ncbi:LPXTG cell wall anchor domain-containing protein [Breznakia pachnodae]|uniref:LPXTG-motif cell wall-anchored protein n=1 Tax=Breznakia pachnodae TaxID=265178 RepID=A0ABU0E195_9FIRM|nr:LPXTG cell wall anchor domain-containing protein [Breznakia pachnodae]MDQ0360644.1 LPXTG-motif cell wall-anchored protein [Breznakia pachnodae]
MDEAQKQLDEKNFVVLEAFKVFTGKGTVYTKIDAPVEKFTKVYVDGKELAASNYEVTSGSTVITLNGTYLKTLANGTYDVDVEFSSGAVVKTKLTVNVSNNPSTKPTDPSQPTVDAPTVSKPSVNPNGTSTSGVNTVNTGDQTNMVLLYGLLISSLLGIAVVTKKRKMQ